MARPHDYSALPAHPAVSPHYKKARKYGGTTVVADVTCPGCSEVRSFPLYTLREQMKRANFGGHCRACMLKQAREGATRWRKTRYKKGSRWETSAGYIALGSSAIVDAELPMFRAMLKTGGSVLEHRWVMAKHLGRPLRSDECIDHRDGNKTNNEIDNLRIYVRGKNQEGSCNGHGTYYHEWQMAERKVRALKKKLADAHAKA